MSLEAGLPPPEPQRPLKRLEMSISRPVYSYAEFNEQFGESVRPNRPLVELAREAAVRACCTCSRERWLQRLRNLVPLVSLFRSGKYGRTDLVSDVIAGFTTCVFHIPQGLAYGLLASLKPINGLYTSLIPVFIFAIFGRSRHLSIGTFSLMALLMSDMVLNNYEAYLPRINPNDSLPLNYTNVEYAKLQTAIVGSLAASLIILVIGVFRLGIFMRYVSDAMLQGFTTGAAVQVIVSQLPLLLGVSPKRSDSQFKVVGSLVSLFHVIRSTNLPTLGISAACCVVLFLFKEYINPLVKKKTKVPLPIELVVIVITLLVSEFADLNSHLGVSIVGDVPRGLPTPVIPDFGFLPSVLPSAVSIGIVGGVVTMSLAKVYCLQFQYGYDFNEDFLVFGVSNLASCFFQCFFACGALARNAVVVSVGMRSQLSSLISCAGMLLVLLAVGPYFRAIPNCALASIIVVSLIGVLKQVAELPKVWRVSRIDFAVWIVAALAVVAFGVSLGLAFGFAFTMFSVILRTQSPRIAVLGQVRDTDIYKNVLVYAAALEVPGVKIVRFDAPLNFTNAERFRDFMVQLAAQLKAGEVDPNSEEAPIHTIVFDCSSWVYADMVGVRAIRETYQCLKKLGFRVLFATCKESVRVHLFLQDFFEEVGRSLFFIGLHDAVVYARSVPPLSAFSDAADKTQADDSGADAGGNLYDSPDAEAATVVLNKRYRMSTLV